jgi:O-antigen ligase
VAVIVIAELVTLALSQHPLSSVLGSYRYRLGLATHMALLVLLVGTATSVRTEREAAFILRVAGVGIAVVAIYGLLQAWGIDPVDWHVRNPGEAALGTLGNQNDMAGFVLLGAGALLAAALAASQRHRWLLLAAAATLTVVVVVTTHSRSGLGALVIFMAACIACAAISRWPLRELVLLGGSLAAATVAGAAITLASGDLEVTLGRVEQTVALSDDQGDSFSAGSFFGARRSIWRGSWAVFAAHPLIGSGQDSLYWEFHRERPEDLGVPFDALSPSGTDPLLASPHSAPLEVLVSNGVVGLLCAGAVGAFVAWRCLRGLVARRSGTVPFLAAGMAAYLAMAMLNPLPLACLALLAVLSGIVVGTTSTTAANTPAPARASHPLLGARLAAAAVPAMAVVFSLVALTADNGAYAASNAARDGDFGSAAGEFGRAAALLPIESTYRREQASYTYLAAANQQDVDRLIDAYNIQQEFLNDFGGLAVDHLLMALIQATLGDPAAADSLRAAREASPYGLNTEQRIEQIEATLAGE